MAKISNSRQQASESDGRARAFDRLAPVYDLLAGVVFCGAIGCCRRDLLRQLRSPQRILIVGGGTGGCGVELARQFPQAKLVIVDISRAMLARTAKRLRAIGCEPQLIHGDILEVDLPEVDLIVTHCFIDCFEGDAAAAVVARLTGALRNGGQWHWSDFAVPEQAGLRRGATSLAIGFTYRCFNLIGAFSHHRLPDADALFRQHGFVAITDASRLGGMLRSAIYQGSQPPPEARSEIQNSPAIASRIPGIQAVVA